MLELPSVCSIAGCHLTRLTNLLSDAYRSHYGKEKPIEIRTAARDSIGSSNVAKFIELQQTIHLIQLMKEQITQVENQINPIVDSLNNPIMTIPGILYRMGAMIIAEIDDLNDFDLAEKILAFTSMEPLSTSLGK